MTPTPKRANSKKKIRESLSLVVNAIPLDARAPTRVLNSFGKRVFVSLLSRVSLSRSRRRPKTTARRRANAKGRQLPNLFFESTKVSKAVTSRYLQNRRKRRKRRSGQRVQRATLTLLRWRLLRATKACYYRVCCGAQRLFKA